MFIINIGSKIQNGLLIRSNKSDFKYKHTFLHLFQKLLSLLKMKAEMFPGFLINVKI